MPYIQTVSNRDIPQEKREAIKTQLGKDIGKLGKTEDWLMVDFCENSPLYFKGSAEPAAVVAVDLYGAAGKAAYAEMTVAITKLLSAELALPPERIFIKYSEYDHWGWNGRNF